MQFGTALLRTEAARRKRSASINYIERRMLLCCYLFVEAPGRSRELWLLEPGRAFAALLGLYIAKRYIGDAAD
jgi:hypothetical protein